MKSAADLVASHSTGLQVLHEQYPLLGLARLHHVNKRGEPMSYVDKPFLLPLLSTLPTLEGADFCKGVQVGISEALIMLMLYNAGWRDRICAYVLPQYETGRRFVDTRIDPLLERVGVYSQRTAGSSLGDQRSQNQGSLKRKRFGTKGWLMFLGSNTESDFLEFTADMAVVDEYDACDLNNVAKIRDRLRESPTPQLFHVSNPSHSGVGAHRLWLDGNRSRWYHKCTRCNHKQPLDWFVNVVHQNEMGMWIPLDSERAWNPDLGDIRPVCRRCHRPFDRTHVGSAWVAENPSTHRHSYHMSRLDILSSPRAPQPFRELYEKEWLLAQGDIGKLQAFWRGALGWPYVPPGSQVTLPMLQLAMAGQAPNDYDGGPENEELVLVMGVDVGTLLHVSISMIAERKDGTMERHGKLVCTVADFDELYNMVRKFRVDVLVIDWQPETRKAKELRDFFTKMDPINESDWHSCSVWLCRFHSQPKAGVDWAAIRLDYDERMVSVDRTQAFDHTLLDIKEGRKKFPSDAATVLGFTDQMQAPVRRNSGESIVWDEGGKADHFRLADLYERVALEIFNRQGVYFAV